MKNRMIYLVIFLLLITLLQANSALFKNSPVVDKIDEQTSNEHIEEAGLHMPEHIKLSFSTLELESLPLEEGKPEWKLIKSFSVMEIDNSPVQIDVYDTSPAAGSIQGNYIGMLTYQDHEYFIPTLAHALVENDVPTCSQLCIYDYELHHQSLLLFASVDISSNGPGLKKYFIYDKQQHTILSIDLWGESYFLDLDQDGEEEWIVQFEGLHLSMPDVAIITHSELGIQWTDSVLSSLDDAQKYAATIDVSGAEALFSVTRFIGDEPFSEVTAQYHYSSQQLVKY